MAMLNYETIVREDERFHRIEVLDRLTAIFFTLELLAGCIVQGFVLRPRTYLRDPWNQLDFVVIVSMDLALLLGLLGVGGGRLHVVSAMRAFRALRPLRSLRFFRGIRAILESLQRSVRLLADVVTFLVFVFIMFGVIGIETYGNSLARRCVMNTTSVFNNLLFERDVYLPVSPATFCKDHASCIKMVGNFSLCDTDYGGVHPLMNFDNFGSASLSLVRTLSLDGWDRALMHPLQESEYLFSTAIYFVAVVIFLSWFALKLFVAVIMESFAKVRREQHRSAFSFKQLQERRRSQGGALASVVADGIEEDQKEAERELARGEWIFRRLVDSDTFKWGMTGIVVINTVTLSLEREGLSEAQDTKLYRVEIMFTSIFVLEMLIKMLAYKGVMHYLKEPGNKFDFFLVIMSLLAFAVDALNHRLHHPPNLTLLRVFRLLRLVRVLGRFKRLKLLLTSILSSWDAVINLFVFMGFHILVFAILGMQMFAGYCCDGCEETLDFSTCCNRCSRTNFNSFSDAVLSLFYVLTGDNWSAVMYDTWDAGGPRWFIPIYFVSYFMITTYVVLNLYVAIILENFELQEAEKVANFAMKVKEKERIQRRARALAARRRTTAWDATEGGPGLRDKDLVRALKGKKVPGLADLLSPGKPAEDPVGGDTSDGSVGAKTTGVSPAGPLLKGSVTGKAPEAAALRGYQEWQDSADVEGDVSDDDNAGGGSAGGDNTARWRDPYASDRGEDGELALQSGQYGGWQVDDRPSWDRGHPALDNHRPRTITKTIVPVDFLSSRLTPVPRMPSYSDVMGRLHFGWGPGAAPSAPPPGGVLPSATGLQSPGHTEGGEGGSRNWRFSMDGIWDPRTLGGLPSSERKASSAQYHSDMARLAIMGSAMMQHGGQLGGGAKELDYGEIVSASLAASPGQPVVPGVKSTAGASGAQGVTGGQHSGDGPRPRQRRSSEESRQGADGMADDATMQPLALVPASVAPQGRAIASHHGGGYSTPHRLSNSSHGVGKYEAGAVSANGIISDVLMDASEEDGHVTGVGLGGLPPGLALRDRPGSTRPATRQDVELAVLSDSAVAGLLPSEMNAVGTPRRISYGSSAGSVGVGEPPVVVPSPRDYLGGAHTPFYEAGSPMSARSAKGRGRGTKGWGGVARGGSGAASLLKGAGPEFGFQPIPGRKEAFGSHAADREPSGKPAHPPGERGGFFGSLLDGLRRLGHAGSKGMEDAARRLTKESSSYSSPGSSGRTIAPLPQIRPIRVNPGPAPAHHRGGSWTTGRDGSPHGGVRMRRHPNQLPDSPLYSPVYSPYGEDSSDEDAYGPGPMSPQTRAMMFGMDPVPAHLAAPQHPYHRRNMRASISGDPYGDASLTAAGRPLIDDADILDSGFAPLSPSRAKDEGRSGGTMGGPRSPTAEALGKGQNGRAGVGRPSDEGGGARSADNADEEAQEAAQDDGWDTTDLSFKAPKSRDHPLALRKRGKGGAFLTATRSGKGARGDPLTSLDESFWSQVAVTQLHGPRWTDLDDDLRQVSAHYGYYHGRPRGPARVERSRASLTGPSVSASIAVHPGRGASVTVQGGGSVRPARRMSSVTGTSVLHTLGKDSATSQAVRRNSTVASATSGRGEGSDEEGDEEAGERQRQGPSEMGRSGGGVYTPSRLGVEPPRRPRALAGDVSRAVVLGQSMDQIAELGKSLGYFSHSSVTRQLCIMVSSSRRFDHFIMACIFVSTALLTLDDVELRKKEGRFTAIRFMDKVFTGIFLLEMLIKVVARGLLFTRRAYLKDGWNIVDLLVVITSLLGSFTQLSGAKALRVLRLGRVIKPLRIIRANTNMKLIMDTMMSCAEVILYIILLNLTVYVIFGVLGVTLFRGKFARCNDPGVASRADCVGWYVASLAPGGWNGNGQPPLMQAGETAAAVPRIWRNPWYGNFDNSASAYNVLIHVSTFKWILVGASAMDTTGVRNVQPGFLESRLNGIYFFVFIFVSLFCWNLFVAVLLDGFERQTGWYYLTHLQRQWVEIKRMIALLKLQQRYRPPKAPLRLLCFKLATHRWTDRVVCGVVAANTVLMASTFYEDPDDRSWGDTLDLANNIFLAFYLVEMVVKLLGLGWRNYFRSSWNRMDALLVVGGAVGWVLQKQGMAMATDIVRLFRVARLLRLIRSARGLRVMVETIWYAFPALLNVLFLTFLVFFVYAIIGMELFGHTRFGRYINRRTNFRNFLSAMVLLFMAANGDQWDGLQYELSVSRPACATLPTVDWDKPNDPIDDCGSRFAGVYLYSFYVLVVYVLMSMFVAVILENFRHCYTKEDSPIPPSKVAAYSALWTTLDPEATGMIPLKALEEFLLALPPPLRVDGASDWETFLLVEGIAKLYLLRDLQDPTRKNPLADDGMLPFKPLLALLCIVHLGVDSLCLVEREEWQARMKRVADRRKFRAKGCDVISKLHLQLLMRRNPLLTMDGAQSNTVRRMSMSAAGAGAPQVILLDTPTTENAPALVSAGVEVVVSKPARRAPPTRAPRERGKAKWASGIAKLADETHASLATGGPGGGGDGGGPTGRRMAGRGNAVLLEDEVNEIKAISRLWDARRKRLGPEEAAEWEGVRDTRRPYGKKKRWKSSRRAPQKSWGLNAPLLSTDDEDDGGGDIDSDSDDGRHEEDEAALKRKQDALMAVLHRWGQVAIAGDAEGADPLGVRRRGSSASSTSSDAARLPSLSHLLKEMEVKRLQKKTVNTWLTRVATTRRLSQVRQFDEPDGTNAGGAPRKAQGGVPGKMPVGVWGNALGDAPGVPGASPAAQGEGKADKGGEKASSPLASPLSFPSAPVVSLL
eukprot:jgi/Mesvir1/13029/Mv06022-RA.1